MSKSQCSITYIETKRKQNYIYKFYIGRKYSTNTRKGELGLCYIMGHIRDFYIADWWGVYLVSKLLGGRGIVEK